MLPPWYELSQCALAALELREANRLHASTIRSLRQHFERCKSDPDAEEAICFHGAYSLIAEFDGDLRLAIEHRRIEIQKIRKLHDLARMNEGDMPGLESYSVEELERRIGVLDDLIGKITT